MVTLSWQPPGPAIDMPHVDGRVWYDVNDQYYPKHNYFDGTYCGCHGGDPWGLVSGVQFEGNTSQIIVFLNSDSVL